MARHCGCYSGWVRRVMWVCVTPGNDRFEPFRFTGVNHGVFLPYISVSVSLTSMAFAIGIVIRRRCGSRSSATSMFHRKRSPSPVSRPKDGGKDHCGGQGSWLMIRSHIKIPFFSYFSSVLAEYAFRRPLDVRSRKDKAEAFELDLQAVTKDLEEITVF